MPKNINLEKEIMSSLQKSANNNTSSTGPILETLKNVKGSDELSSNLTGKEISLTQFINNPTGKGSAYVAKRSAIKQGLNLTFVKLLKEYRNAFYAIPYILSTGDILFLVKVPSEDYKNNKISYDVLIKFYHDSKKNMSSRNVQFFSNCPSFIYTYTYVFNKEGLLIPEYKSKFPNEALTQKPVVRNPIESLGYEKSLYIAGRYLMDSNCLSDNYISRYGKIMTETLKNEVNRRIADPENIVAIYQHAKYQQAKTHRKELDKNELKNRDKRNKDYADQQKKNTPKHTIFNKGPRGNITAKKALKNITSIKSSKSKKNK